MEPRRDEVLTYLSTPSAQLFERELGLGLAQTDVVTKVRAISLAPHPHPAAPHLTPLSPAGTCAVTA